MPLKILFVKISVNLTRFWAFDNKFFSLLVSEGVIIDSRTDPRSRISLPRLIKKVNLFTQSRTGLQIYEGHDDQLNRPGPMA
jgi:hypothetical protein